MKKLNRILILLALLSFVSCGTASMYEDEDIEVSNTNTDEQKNFDKAAVAENQQQSASESVAEKTETAGTAGEDADRACLQLRHDRPDDDRPAAGKRIPGAGGCFHHRF